MVYWDGVQIMGLIHTVTYSGSLLMLIMMDLHSSRAAFQPGLGQLIDEDRALSLLLVKYDQVWQGLHMSPPG